MVYYRTNISDPTRNCNVKESQFGECGIEKRMHLRPPLAVLVQNSNAGNMPTQQHLINTSKVPMDDGKQPLHLLLYFLREKKNAIRSLFQIMCM